MSLRGRTEAPPAPLALTDRDAPRRVPVSIVLKTPECEAILAQCTCYRRDQNAAAIDERRESQRAVGSCSLPADVLLRLRGRGWDLHAVAPRVQPSRTLRSHACTPLDLPSQPRHRASRGPTTLGLLSDKCLPRRHNKRELLLVRDGNLAIVDLATRKSELLWAASVTTSQGSKAPQTST
jgi:hypothetical protein